MGKGVRGVVSAAADIAADEAEPEIEVCVADCAFICYVCVCVFGEAGGAVAFVREAAYWTAAAGPFLETCTVEDVLTDDGQQTRCFVHTFQTDGTCR